MESIKTFEVEINRQIKKLIQEQDDEEKEYYEMKQLNYKLKKEYYDLIGVVDSTRAAKAALEKEYYDLKQEHYDLKKEYYDLKQEIAVLEQLKRELRKQKFVMLL